jgi:hypothetical protein
MSNKYLIPLIVAILISTIVAVSVNQFNKFSNSKVAIVSCSSVVVTQSSLSQLSSTSSQIVSNSSIIKAQPLIISSAPKVVESMVVESVKPVNKTPKKVDCEIPTEMLKFKSDSGCYTFQVLIPYDADDSYPLKSKELADFSRNTLGADFYNRIKGLSDSSHISIVASAANKVSENIFYVRLGFFDIDYLKSNNISGTDANTFEGEYTVNLNEPKSFKLDSFLDRTKK